MSTQVVAGTRLPMARPRFEDGRHRLVCRVCGRTEGADCALGTAGCLLPASAAGYAVDAAEVVFRGVCPDCRGKNAENVNN